MNKNIFKNAKCDYKSLWTRLFRISNTKISAIALFLFVCLNSNATVFTFSADTVVHVDTTVVNAFDTIYINNNARVTIGRLVGVPENFKSKYNLMVKKILVVESGSSLKGEVGNEGYLGITSNVIIVNNSGKDSIRNISLNMLGNNLTLKGQPISFINVIAGMSNRNIFMDTTLTLQGNIFYFNPDVIKGEYQYLDLSGDTLVLGDTAKFDTKLNYSAILADSGGVVKRIISTQDIGQTDTIPIGISTSNMGDGNWIYLSLHDNVTLGANPYLLYELVPVKDSVVDAYGITAFTKYYLKITGNDVNNLSYNIKYRYSNNDVTGGEQNLWGAFYNGSTWKLFNQIDTVINLIYSDTLTQWGKFTAMGIAFPSNVSPVVNATKVKLADTIKADFPAIKALNTSLITIKDSEMNLVTGVNVSIDSISPTVFQMVITHDAFTKNNAVYTLTIPEKSIQTINNIPNRLMGWSFTTVKVKPDTISVSPSVGSQGNAAAASIIAMFNQPISIIDTIVYATDGITTLIGKASVVNNNELHLNFGGLTNSGDWVVGIPAGTVANSELTLNDSIGWAFNVGTVNISKNEKPNFIVYPNPSKSGKITVAGDIASVVYVYNMLGQMVVVKNKLQGNNLDIELAKGQYLLKIENENYVEKIIIE